MEPIDPIPVWRVMVRARWIAALVLALAVSAVFGLLSQWQIGRAVENATVIDYQSETVVPLTSVAEPMAPLTTEAGGHMVSVEVRFVPGDEQILTDRRDEHGSGYWVVSHAVLTEKDASGHPVALAVARGWSPDESVAREAARRLGRAPSHPVTVTGRLMPSESPSSPHSPEDVENMSALSPAYLVNVWSDMDGVDTYNAYVISDEPAADLQPIYAPPPAEDRSLNWLNVFYAIEWVVFAGFAVFLWYRLVKDATQRENELAAQEAGAAAPDGAAAADTAAAAHVDARSGEVAPAHPAQDEPSGKP